MTFLQDIQEDIERTQAVQRLVEVARKIENQASVIYSAGGFPGVAIPGELFEELRQALGDCYE